MKVIDLLNKIANEEDIPSPIYHNNLYYDFEDGDYFNQKTGSWLFNDSDIETILNDEVEIIEKDKKIRKITINDNGTLGFPKGQWTARNMDKAFAFIINEIIDKINSMEEK